MHYTSYGLMIGLIGLLFGVAIGYVVAAVIISPNGMMGTYIDMPVWDLVMPAFCIPVMACMLAFLTLISYLSVKKMLKGTAADALRPYTPRAMKTSVLEQLPFWNKLPFGTKWNVRDILRHKSRSAMTLVGVIGCTLLLVGGLGMKDTMESFLGMLDDDISNYTIFPMPSLRIKQPISWVTPKTQSTRIFNRNASSPSRSAESISFPRAHS